MTPFTLVRDPEAKKTACNRNSVSMSSVVRLVGVVRDERLKVRTTIYETTEIRIQEKWGLPHLPLRVLGLI
jgi:hypothetical protein